MTYCLPQVYAVSKDSPKRLRTLEIVITADEAIQRTVRKKKTGRVIDTRKRFIGCYHDWPKSSIALLLLYGAPLTIFGVCFVFQSSIVV